MKTKIAAYAIAACLAIGTIGFGVIAVAKAFNDMGSAYDRADQQMLTNK